MQRRCLIDTNILLRISEARSRDHQVCIAALGAPQSDDAELCYTLQNAAEFWNVSTRPIDRNGQGLAPQDTARGLAAIERKMVLLPDTPDVYLIWRRLVIDHEVRGVQVHDARLAAAMIVHGVPRILTLNGVDFSRYKEVQAVHPSSLV